MYPPDPTSLKSMLKPCTTYSCTGEPMPTDPSWLLQGPAPLPACKQVTQSETPLTLSQILLRPGWGGGLYSLEGCSVDLPDNSRL